MTNLVSLADYRDDASDYILESARTVTVAGSGFGLEGYIRLSYATEESVFLEGIDRIEKALENLS